MNINYQQFLPWPWAPETKNILVEPLTQNELLAQMIMSGCIWLIAILFFSMLMSQLYRACKYLSRLNRGLKILGSASQDTLVTQRREIDDQMDKITDLGELWHEFDETLLECPSGKCIYNTLDADHFFNSSTLGAGVTENRFIAAVPGMLTAIGVFGTFLGLQLGLRSLNLDGDADKLQASIKPLISGAAVAFTTSVWGVLASLLFNVTEKIIEGGLLKKIRRFQLKTDRLFARNLGEKSLLNIQESTIESEKLLRVLGEQIGEKIQEGISSAIEPQLQRLADTMESLADRQASGAEEALRNLVEEFSSQMGEAGKEQAQAMDRSAESLAGAMKQLDETISNFLSQVSSRIDQLAEANEKSHEKLNDFSIKSDEFTTQSQNTLEQYTEATTAFENTVATLSAATTDLSKVHTQFSSTVNDFAVSQTNATNSLQNASGNLMDLSENLNEVSGSLNEAGESMTHLSGLLDNASESIVEATNNASQAFSELPERHQRLLNDTFDTLKSQFVDYSDKISAQFVDFSDSLKGSTENRIDEWTKKTQEFCNYMTGAVEVLSNTIDDIEHKIISNNDRR
jgi:chromosome segregation ATPase